MVKLSFVSNEFIDSLKANRDDFLSDNSVRNDHKDNDKDNDIRKKTNERVWPATNNKRLFSLHSRDSIPLFRRRPKQLVFFSIKKSFIRSLNPKLLLNTHYNYRIDLFDAEIEFHDDIIAFISLNQFAKLGTATDAIFLQDYNLLIEFDKKNILLKNSQLDLLFQQSKFATKKFYLVILSSLLLFY
ncbi:uncharacterized protein ASCRUDRAFT_98983 [Ascoidea rubescens DSM 1968]|uniref:Uncharacterized protein n=1 Tax=Ascoidea rubescens DSM 1968 TaxID=1344418 RepID=A0A1D2VQD3_9ASCO|nr:hypothetical protein ASCRUDRAFT_98983 [Ascoidea rubescens DSM 1968]ODV63811.1 hypothetical protein ASCRUDRAFT_98983 [Ascoidea rubescens DSM 1968]